MQAAKRQQELLDEQMSELTLHPEITRMARDLQRGGFASMAHLTTPRSHHTEVGIKLASLLRLFCPACLGLPDANAS